MEDQLKDDLLKLFDELFRLRNMIRENEQHIFRLIKERDDALHEARVLRSELALARAKLKQQE